MKAEEDRIEKTLHSLDGIQRAAMPEGLSDKILSQARPQGTSRPLLSLPRLAVAASVLLCILNGALLASEWSAASDEQGVDTFAAAYNFETEDTYEPFSAE